VPGVGARRRLAAYADLVRAPNCVTAPPDVVAGAALVVAAGGRVAPTPLAGVAVSSMLLYAGGTTLNDYVDAAADESDRPDRPIPSGRVPRARAGPLGVAFLCGAVALAAAVAGTRAAIGGTAVAAGVLAYDGGLKGGPAGWVAMGATRGLNVLFGTTATAATLRSLPPRALAAAGGVAAYIAGVTCMADGEAGGATRRSVLVAVLGLVAGTAVAGATVLTADRSGVSVAFGVALTAGFALVAGRGLAFALRDPSPATVGPAVGTCILGLVVFDAALAAAAGPRWALAALACLGPAYVLSRSVEVS